MTVKELIEALELIEDKTKEMLVAFGHDYTTGDLTVTERRKYVEIS